MHTLVFVSHQDVRRETVKGLFRDCVRNVKMVVENIGMKGYYERSNSGKDPSLYEKGRSQ